MIETLIWLLVFMSVVYVVKMVVETLELPPPIKQVTLLILGLIALLVILQKFLGYHL